MKKTFTNILFVIIILSFAFTGRQVFAAVETPTGLTIIQNGNQIDINWNGSVDNYRIYRDGVQISTTMFGSTSYTDSPVADGNYTYEIRAYDTTSGTESAPISGSINFVSGAAPAGGGGPPASAYDPGALVPIVRCGGYFDDGVTPQPACSLCDLFEMVSRIMRLILVLGFAFGGLMLVIGGIMMYFGGSSPRMLSNAKSIVKNVIIGIVVMLVSYLLVFTIIHILSSGSADTMFNLGSGGFYIDCY